MNFAYEINLFYFIIILFQFTYSQDDTWKYGTSKDEKVEESITYYDQFNPFMGNKSLRDCGGRKCNGNIIDKYPNDAIKHKGFYTNGQLLNGYENYFENGQLERKVKILGGNKISIVVYYSDGTIRSEIIYLKNRVLMWKDYYPTGNLEYWEEYDSKQTYYTKLNFYYINGNPQSIMELIDKKNFIYVASDYYLDGTIKAQGNKKYLPASGGHVKIGIWKYYNDEGELLELKEHHGEIEDELDFLNE